MARNDLDLTVGAPIAIAGGRAGQRFRWGKVESVKGGVVHVALTAGVPCTLKFSSSTGVQHGCGKDPFAPYLVAPAKAKELEAKMSSADKEAYQLTALKRRMSEIYLGNADAPALLRQLAADVEAWQQGKAELNFKNRQMG